MSREPDASPDRHPGFVGHTEGVNVYVGVNPQERRKRLVPDQLLDQCQAVGLVITRDTDAPMEQAICQGATVNGDETWLGSCRTMSGQIELDPAANQLLVVIHAIIFAGRTALECR